jgi:N-carbamoyl-L-amino-acid hydrolase
MNLEIDQNELLGDLQTLATYSVAAAPAVTRIVFSAEDMAARKWLKNRCADAGLQIREDAAGNTFFRWIGEDPNLPAVATGSHIDAIPNAGMYDGTVGVLGGLEAIRALQRAEFRPHRSIELVLFTSEEPTRFGIGCIGSRILSGALPPDRARQFKDSGGLSIDEVRTFAGFEGTLEEAVLPEGHYSAFVELHIEQGPELERENVSIGIVTNIAAPAGLKIAIEGEGGHAGAVLMPSRKDALTAASEIILAVEKAARNSGSIDTVATVGVCKVFPGAVNSVPSRVNLEVDIRDTNLERRDRVLQSILEKCAETAAQRDVKVTPELLNADPPAASAPHILKAIGSACMELGIPFRPMVSRAYHDSLFLSRIAPTAMIFIPCRGGVSHRPDEYSSPEAISTGALVLAKTLAQLSS